jgi:hypothetical protein
MPGCLLRTHAAIADCNAHLQASSAFGTEIESYLTQYLVVILCADVQQEIYRLSEERAALAADGGLSSFVASSARKVLRSVGKSEIAKYVGMFGADCKERLNGQLEDHQVTVYNNAVCDRHEVAHSQGTMISFAELVNAVRAAEKIIEAVAYSFGIGPPVGPVELPNQE